MDERLEAFNLFTQERQTELQRLASSSNGEQELLDVIGQAWIIAEDMIATGGMTDVRDTQFQEWLLGQLRKHFRNRSSYIRRYLTTRLDVNEYDHDSLEPHPLMRILVSESPDPLTDLVDQEENIGTEPSEIEMECPCSLAGAYGKLLDFFDRNILKLAEYLLISKKQARRRCDDVRLLAFHQRPLRYPLPSDFLPGPWHSRRPKRRTMQLTFEFSYQLEFEY